MYNAQPVEAVVYLTNFMRTFMKKYPKKTNPTNAKMWNYKINFILYTSLFIYLRILCMIIKYLLSRHRFLWRKKKSDNNYYLYKNF